MQGCDSSARVSSSSLLIRSHHGRCQANTPLSPLCKFAEPPLTVGRWAAGQTIPRSAPYRKWLVETLVAHIRGDQAVAEEHAIPNARRPARPEGKKAVRACPPVGVDGP